MSFDGETYEASKDELRLTAQLMIVRRVMGDGDWHTLPQLADEAKCTTQSVSARLRDLRKRKFGARIIERRRTANAGLFEYRMLPGEGDPREQPVTARLRELEAENAALRARVSELEAELDRLRRPRLFA